MARDDIVKLDCEEREKSAFYLNHTWPVTSIVYHFCGSLGTGTGSVIRNVDYKLNG